MGIEPLMLTADGDLACAACGEPVVGILMPVSARLRPRATPESSEITADVIVGANDATLQPCGCPYPTDDLPSRRMGEARPENSMAQRTECQTPGARFHTRITGTSVEVSVDLPRQLDLDASKARLLERNLHNAVELVLAPYFAARPENS